jgi:DNA repair protein RecO (recombination protein O)
VSWRARLSEQLGNYAGELREAHAARALDDAAQLAGLSAACAFSTPPCPSASRIRRCSTASRAFCGALGHPGWPAIYVRLELGLLQELGFGLDLDKCAATGATEDLAYVSPKTGRAVSRAAPALQGEADRLPAFLSTGGLPADERDCARASI